MPSLPAITGDPSRQEPRQAAIGWVTLPAMSTVPDTAATAVTDRWLVEQALGGDPTAIRALVDRLTPVVQARVARVLLRRTGAALGRDVRQEVEDLAQDIFVALFEDRAYILRSWSEGLGLSLANFVGLVAERRTHSALRSRRQSPWTEDPIGPTEIERTAGESASMGAQLAERDLLRVVLDRLRAALSPKGLLLFRLLMVDQLPIDAICVETGMTAAAIYAWRSRLAKQARQIRDDALAEGKREGLH